MIEDITPNPNTQNQPAPEPIADNSQILGLKVLCIEDEPFIGDLYKRALDKAGYQTELVTDGIAGLERARSNEFDIILLDIMIPQLLGVDVLHELRRAVKLKAKIVIATNLEQDNETRAKIEQEADAYIIKAEVTPVELVEFLKKL